MTRSRFSDLYKVTVSGPIISETRYVIAGTFSMAAEAARKEIQPMYEARVEVKSVEFLGTALFPP